MSMKKTFIYLSAVVLSLATACNKEVPAPQVQDAETIVSVGLDPQTKTTLSPEDKGVRQVLWSKGDQITINGVTSRELPASAEGSKLADFAFDSVLPDPTSQQPWDVLYPSTIYVDANTISLAQTQEIAEGDNVQPNVLPMAARTETKEVTLAHLCGILSFQLQKGHESDILDNLKITANNGEQLSGDFTIDYATGALTAVEGNADVQVRILESLTEGVNTVVNVVVPAGVYADGFNVAVTDTKGHSFVKTLSGSKTVVAGQILVMPAAFDVDVPDFFVTPEGAGDKKGTNWENAMGAAEFAESLSTASDAVSGSSFYLAAGTYGVSEAVVVANGAKVYGGFPTNLKGTLLTGRDAQTNVTAIVPAEGAHAFELTSDVELTFSGVTFKNAKAPEADGGIFNASNGKLILNGCTFKDNAAQRGGAIYVTAAEIVASKCNFENCSSSNHGGVLMTNDENAKLSFTECNFNKCKAGGNSGVFSLGSGQLVAQKCVFDGNTLTGTNNSPVARINKWLNNSDAGDPVKARFVECEFKNNVNPGTTWQYTAGCFAIGKADVEFDGCVFDNNKAYRGAAFTTVQPAANVVVKNSTFKRNSSTSHGSVFNNEAKDTHVTFENCLFEENKSGDQGVFYADHKTSYFYATGCTFKNNSAKNGAIAGSYASRAQSTLHFDNCYFEGNRQESRSMFIGGGPTAYMLNNCQFYNNYNTTRTDWAWGLLTHGGAVPCINAVTVYNDTYGEQTVFGSDNDVLVINSTVIIPAYGGTEKGLVRSNAHKVTLANNILIKSNCTSLVEDASAVKTYGHNVYGPETGAKFVPAASDYHVAGVSDLGSASYNVSLKAYIWSGPSVLSGFSAASKAEILSAIAEHNSSIDGKNVGAEFKAWLESLPSRPLDRSYAWPGAYIPAN